MALWLFHFHFVFSLVILLSDLGNSPPALSALIVFHKESGPGV